MNQVASGSPVPTFEGQGVFIRRVGESQHYGHVELRLSFPKELKEHRVEFTLKNEGIMKKDWPSISEAAAQWLDLHAVLLGGRKAKIEVFDGSWTGDVSAHAQATPFALREAARKAGILDAR